MVAAANRDAEVEFYALYDQLNQLCEDTKGHKNDHPVLWETLADFTEENDQAIAYYRYAFDLADLLKDNEYKASIQYALAQRCIEQGRLEEAKLAVVKAEKFASFTEDEELQSEVRQLLNELDR